jgi:hypothetical protein
MATHVIRAAESFDRRSFNELWVIDAERRRTFVHGGPSPAGWRTTVERAQDKALTLTALPGFSAQLATM